MAELNASEHPDTLSRWMAHYLAERIADAGVGPQREQKQQACADEILKVWEHRRSFSEGARPFENYDSILRTLDTLDLDDRRPRHFRYLRDSKDESETGIWLRTASGIDSAAKVLIRYCLSLAAAESNNKSREWVALAEECTDSDQVDVQVICRLLGDEDLFELANPTNLKRKELEGMVTKLQEFESIAAKLRQVLREQLEGLTNDTADNAGPPSADDDDANASSL